MTRLEPAVSVYGTSRKLKPGSRLDDLTRWTGRCLAERGLPVRTGGGDGVMAGALEGFIQQRDSNVPTFHLTDTVGRRDLKTQAINIKLPWEQKLNPYAEVAHEVGTPLGLLYRELGLYINSLAVLPGGGGHRQRTVRSLGTRGPGPP